MMTCLPFRIVDLRQGDLSRVDEDGMLLWEDDIPYPFEVVDLRLPGHPSRGRFESKSEALARVAELEASRRGWEA